MILSNAINIRSCIVCFAHQSENETISYFNAETGHYHRFIYLTKGQLDTYVTDSPEVTENDKVIQLEANELYDLAPTLNKHVISIAKNSDASMAMFNPIPLDRDISVEILKDQQSRLLEPSDTRVTIVCLVGSIDANGKTLNSMQFAKVPADKSVVVNLKDGDVCAIVTG